MKTIYPNRSRIIGKVIILISLSIGQYFLIKGLIIDSKDKSGIGLLYFVSFLLLFACITLITSFLGVTKVELSSSSKEITFYRIFSKQVLPTSDIVGYYSFIESTKTGTSYGRILKTTKDKIVTLDPGNLSDIDELDEYLNGLNIEYLGNKGCLYPFTSGL